MTSTATLPARITHFLRGIFCRNQVERELEQEIDSHLDMLVEQKISEGMSLGEARFTACQEFGNVEQVTAQVRNVWLSAYVESVVITECRRCLRSFFSWS